MLDIVYNNDTIPAAAPGALPRPRLQALLSTAAKHRLVTVVAGAGYGKTQAVSGFAATAAARVAWLPLARLDNFSGHFWRAFCQALAAPCPELAPRLARLGFPDSLAKFDLFLQLFLPHSRKGRQLLLVMDDFHLLEDEGVRGFVENLLAAKPENFCLLLISRQQPRFAPGLPAQEPAARLSGEDLRFTAAETEQYLLLQGLNLPPARLRQICEATDGWPLALYLCTLSLQKGMLPPGHPLDGALPQIFELIERELFALYSPEIQDFLIRLSLLESFPLELIPQLAAAGAEIADQLSQTNMFIRYDPLSRHYHFHPLFAEFLRARQQRLPLQERRQFYAAAGDWYAREGLFIDAVSCYKECGGHAQIWQTIVDTAPERYPQKTAAELIGLLDAFPAEFVAGQPLVRVVRASLLLNNLRLTEGAREMTALITEYQARPDTRENRAVLGEAYIVLGLIDLTQRDLSFVHCFREAHHCLPQGSFRDYSRINIVDSNCSIILNSLDPEELEQMQSSLFAALPYLSQVMHGCGLGAEYLAAAETAYYRGDFTQAELNAFQAIYRSRHQPQSDIVGGAYFLLARLSAAQGHYQQSADYLSQLSDFVRDNVESGFLSMQDIAEGWLFIQLGETERLARWLTDQTLNQQIYPPISIGRDRLIRALALLEEGQYPELLALLAQLDELYRDKGLWLELVSVMALTSIALYQLGQPEWLAALETAYQAAGRSGFIMQFVEMGQYMRTITESAKKAAGQHDIPPEWLETLHTKASTYAKRQAYARSQQQKRQQTADGAAALSKREREVLHNLCQGLTREEIAISLGISINTVKSTLKNIYSKLGAINSADAARIALSRRVF